MAHPIPDFAHILLELARHKVDFIVVGGVGAALQGAPITTLDVDVVHSREEDNVARLIEALNELGAFYREQPAKRLKPDPNALAGPEHHLLMTDAGPLDLLGAISKGRTFKDLLPDSIEIEAITGTSIRVLNLATLIVIKEELGREKDRAILPILRRTLEEQ